MGACGPANDSCNSGGGLPNPLQPQFALCAPTLHTLGYLGTECLVKPEADAVEGLRVVLGGQRFHGCARLGQAAAEGLLDIGSHRSSRCRLAVASIGQRYAISV